MCKLISVIVPVYNVANYLEECVCSIIKQTYQAWELILVDDGSTDDSGKLCDIFAEKNRKIKVIHQENKGVSVARNTGILNATGEYLMFIDADDWVEPLMLEQMINVITETGSDACYCDRYYKDESKIQILLSEDFPNEVDAKEIMRRHLHYGFLASTWLGLIDRRKTKDCMFDTEIHTLEDWEYNFRAISCMDKISILKKPFYHYRTVEGSASKSSLNAKKLSCLLIPEKVNDYIRKNNLPCIEEAKYVPVFLINHLLVILANNEYRKVESRQLKIEARKQLLYVWTGKNIPVRQKIYISMCAVSPRIFCVVYRLKYGGEYHE